ncbi:hypothetical protein PSHT_07240 [Puccinia striiformis]|uniref:Uncharacterized protein n=1 Tax=Puccinia striiformis TaxID=27350 RepID=A0A2S4VZV1_9BASI|nr:hypothetical protein PSHT_07240 [Puccinia striiformis]
MAKLWHRPKSLPSQISLPGKLTSQEWAGAHSKLGQVILNNLFSYPPPTCGRGKPSQEDCWVASIAGHTKYGPDINHLIQGNLDYLDFSKAVLMAYPVHVKFQLNMIYDQSCPSYPGV